MDDNIIHKWTSKVSEDLSLLEKTKIRYNHFSFCKEIPTPKQTAFLLLNCFDAFLGGAAGPGKSSCLLMAAAQYVDIPGYAALLLRSTYRDLALPGAIMDRSKKWWYNEPDTHWSETDKTWTFPSGARIVFGHLQGPSDHYNYDSSEFQFIGADEATKMRWFQLQYLMSRIRRSPGIPDWLPLRFRTASNPGGPSHNALKERYIDPWRRGEHRTDRIFIPAKLIDNPHLNRDEYTRTLMNLDPITRARLLDGDWDILAEGRLFDRSWFNTVAERPVDVKKRVRFWDLAATEQKDTNDPDWTVGVKMSMTKDKLFYVEDVKRFRKSPGTVENLIRQTAEVDGVGTEVRIEEEGGASGKITTSLYTKVLAGFSFRGVRAKENKRDRARPFSTQAEAGNVHLVRGPWMEKYLDELELFPEGLKDDQVDASSGAFFCLTREITNVYAHWV